jgi:hypothetical protein
VPTNSRILSLVRVATSSAGSGLTLTPSGCTLDQQFSTLTLNTAVTPNTVTLGPVSSPGCDVFSTGQDAATMRVCFLVTYLPGASGSNLVVSGRLEVDNQACGGNTFTINRALTLFNIVPVTPILPCVDDLAITVPLQAIFSGTGIYSPYLPT